MLRAPNVTRPSCQSPVHPGQQEVPVHRGRQAVPVQQVGRRRQRRKVRRQAAPTVEMGSLVTG